MSLWIVSVLLTAAGCAGPGRLPPPGRLAERPEEETSEELAPPPPVWFGGENIYLVGPGDVLRVTVYGEPDISGDFRVSPEGKIAWSWVGDVPVAGRSETEILEQLRGILTGRYIRQPRVEVSVAEYQSQVVYYFGNVWYPGIRRLGENRSLLANLLQAGAPKVWGEVQIGILRTDPGAGSPDRITLEFQSLLDGKTDVLLHNQDIITVSLPEAATGYATENRVYVVGAVNAPGSFRWIEQMTALDALLEAGGLADYASGNRSRLVRGEGEAQQEFRIRFNDILSGSREMNVRLLPGDLLIVPESWF